MRRTRIAAVATAGALAAAGTGVAVATSASDDAKQQEQAVLEDAAGRLDVDADELRDALSAAEDAQLDAEVKAGRLTQEQADAIKQMRERSGLVLGGGPGHPGGPHGFGGERHGGPGEVMGAAAKALGISERKLFTQLRNGKSLQQIAKAQGKDYADVKAAVRDAVKTELDEAVKDGRLTQAQADDMLEHLTDGLDDGFSAAGRAARAAASAPRAGRPRPGRPLGLAVRDRRRAARRYAPRPMQAEAVQVLQRLLRFNTVNPPGAERPRRSTSPGSCATAGLEVSSPGPTRSARTSSRGCAAGPPGPSWACSPTSTRSAPTRWAGATTRGRARSTTAASGAAARST